MNTSYPITGLKQKASDISSPWLYGFVTVALVAISNLVLFLVLGTEQFLSISIGSILCGLILLLSRWTQSKARIYLSALIGITAWALAFIIHAIFLTGVLWILLIGIWLLPVIWFLNLPSNKRRFLVFLPTFIGAVVLYLLNSSFPVTSQLEVSDFNISRYLAPIYFFILGVFVFIFLLRGIFTRRLATKMIISLAIIVFIPIVILTMVAYSNTKGSDTTAATTSLEQIAFGKENTVSGWINYENTGLQALITDNDTYQLMFRLLDAYETGNTVYLQNYRQSLTFILANLAGRYEFEEVYIINPDGIVVMSTDEALYEADFQFNEFFWQAKTDSVILPPRYYPPADQISVFFSHPIFNNEGNLIGVLSARTTASEIISLVTEPALEPYSSTRSYLVNSDGSLLRTAIGRSTTMIDTVGVQEVLSTRQQGSGSYSNADGTPVIGVYRWIPTLNIAILVEAFQSEVYQRLPGIITVNLTIGLLAFVLAVIAAVTIVRSITNPIFSLVDASRDVVDGNLDIQVATERIDELGTLTDAFNKMTVELKTLVTGLESRVADRTRDLESRSLELQTAAVIARDASFATSVNDLLDRTSRLIRERFGYYHVGIFLIDDKDEFAVLYSAAGDAGKILLANKHKLKIGETGIVGTVSKTGEPRIALDVGADAVYFQNPMLPYTRSEMALPLKVGSRVIGVLDVQSDKVNAYDQNDVTIMSILTDQLAIAIERTRLQEETARNTASMELALQAQTSRAWREHIARQSKERGYRFSGVEVRPLSDEDIRQLSERDEISKPIVSIKQESFGCSASIPMLLRNNLIGSIVMNFSTNELDKETLDLLEEASNRISFSLETARLYQDASVLASQEQQINLISGEIQQSNKLDAILQSTIRELGKALRVPRTFIQLGLPPMKENPGKQ